MGICLQLENCKSWPHCKGRVILKKARVVDLTRLLNKGPDLRLYSSFGRRQLSLYECSIALNH
jgi:hypothetical protein